MTAIIHSAQSTLTIHKWEFSFNWIRVSNASQWKVLATRQHLRSVSFHPQDTWRRETRPVHCCPTGFSRQIWTKQAHHGWISWSTCQWFLVSYQSKVENEKIHWAPCHRQIRRHTSAIPMGFLLLWERASLIPRDEGLHVCTRLVPDSSQRGCYTEEPLHASVCLSDWDEGLHVWQACRNTESTRGVRRDVLQYSAVSWKEEERSVKNKSILHRKEMHVKREEELDMIQRTPLVRISFLCLYNHSTYAHPVAKITIALQLVTDSMLHKTISNSTSVSNDSYTCVFWPLPWLYNMTAALSIRYSILVFCKLFVLKFFIM